MRQPSILDVLEAVIQVGRAYPDVRTWWFVPSPRLALTGERSGAPQARSIELALESAVAGPIDCGRIERELSKLLVGGEVVVREHRGHAEEVRLFRLFRREESGPQASALRREAR